MTRRFITVFLGCVAVFLFFHNESASYLLPCPDKYNECNHVQSSTDVVWLERLVSDFEYSDLAYGPYDAYRYRQQAYIRLGQLGTAESLAAIDRIEDKARDSSFHKKQIIEYQFGYDYSNWRYEIELAVTTLDGKLWAVVRPKHQYDRFYLTSKDLGATRWTRSIYLPFLQDVTEMKRLRAVDNNTLELQYIYRKALKSESEAVKSKVTQREKKVTIKINELFSDSDGDGFPDAEEAYYGMSPNSIDSDGDGLADSVDTCPNYNGFQYAGQDTDEDAQIIQKAIFLFVGLIGWDNISLANNPSRRLQIWGYKGTIIYCNFSKEKFIKYSLEHASLHWSEISYDGDVAKIEVGTVSGPLSGHGWTFILKKISGKWYIIGCDKMWES